MPVIMRKDTMRNARSVATTPYLFTKMPAMGIRSPAATVMMLNRLKATIRLSSSLSSIITR